MTIHVYLMTEISCAKYIVKNIPVFSLKSESKQFSFVPTSQREMGDLKKKRGKVNELCNPFYRIGNPFSHICNPFPQIRQFVLSNCTSSRSRDLYNSFP